MNVDRDIQTKIDVFAAVYSNIEERMGEQAAAVITAEVGKSIRAEQLMTARVSDASEDMPATKKQLDYLRDLGVDTPDGLTKHQASELIDAAVAKQNGQ